MDHSEPNLPHQETVKTNISATASECFGWGPFSASDNLTLIPLGPCVVTNPPIHSICWRLNFIINQSYEFPGQKAVL